MGRSMRRITALDLREGSPTPGMVREEAVSTERTWAGIATTDAGMV
ncbi:MAG TPA: hypothetical protein VJ979_10335 [Actinomycetota bacterium]|nr:hypothetical protein [Actinomycetota bacterium]